MVEFNNFFLKLLSDDSSINEILDWNYLKNFTFWKNGLQHQNYFMEIGQLFGISQELDLWPWSNLATKQRTPYYACMNRDSPMKLLSQQWDSTLNLCTLLLSHWQWPILIVSHVLCRVSDKKKITPPKSLSSPTYYQDLTPCNFPIFSKLKHCGQGLYGSWWRFWKWMCPWDKCVRFLREYFEGNQSIFTLGRPSFVFKYIMAEYILDKFSKNT